VTSVNGKTGAVTVTVPTKVSQLQNDSGFLTEISKEEIVQQVITALGTPVFGRVDADNNIILTGELADGTYTLKVEKADGTVVEVGTFTQGVTYTNLLKNALDGSGAVLDGVGYRDGYRLSGGSANSGAMLSNSGGADYFTTGWIPYTIAQAKAKVPIYFKGISINLSNIETYSRLSMAINYNDTTYCDVPNLKDIVNNGRGTLTQLGENYYKLTPLQFDQIASWGSKDLKYIRFSFYGKGAGVIITVDEPIE
jgi:hypothetical protein